MSIGENYCRVAESVAAEARAAGRDPLSVKLIAVSKTADLEGVAQACAAGAVDFGENRPDSLLPKAEAHPDVTWHFIGNIQSRRIADIVKVSDLVHSLYQEGHIAKFDAAARAAGKVQDVLIEVNVSGEESKSGCAADEAFELVAACAACANVRPRGLMTMAPQGDEQAARACFEDLARLHANIRSRLAKEDAESFNELSMGMSEDWREAVRAGSTMVRIGRAVFSESFTEEGQEKGDFPQ